MLRLWLCAKPKPWHRAAFTVARCISRCLQEATERLNCRILLVLDDVSAPLQVIAYGKKINFKNDRKHQVIPLLYKDKHYQLSAPKAGKQPPSEWIDLEPGNHSMTLPRGGGWLPARGSSQASVSSVAASGRRAGGWLSSRCSSTASAASASMVGDDGKLFPSRVPSVASKDKKWMPARTSCASRSAQIKRRATSAGTVKACKSARTTSSTRWAAGSINSLRLRPRIVDSITRPRGGGLVLPFVQADMLHAPAGQPLSRVKDLHIGKRHPATPRSSLARLHAPVIVLPTSLRRCRTFAVFRHRPDGLLILSDC